MSQHPSLAELRTRVFKHSAPVGLSSAPPEEVGSWLARRVARPSAVFGTWLALRCGLSAHQITLAALFAGFASAVCIATGARSGFVAAVLLAHLAYWLDHVDGQVARWRGTAGLDGVYFDYLMHHAATMALGFGLGYGLALRCGDPLWAAGGFLIALGWALLGLHNDCRYKAFFQRLKRESRSFRVDGGAGGRPAAPPGWPARGWGLIAWPLHKICEPHVVLIALTVDGVLAIAAPALWLSLWRGGVRAMALLAPALAAARAARAVRRRAVTAEFDRWFQSWSPSVPGDHQTDGA
jgi:hypothetical protein